MLLVLPVDAVSDVELEGVFADELALALAEDAGAATGAAFGTRDASDAVELDAAVAFTAGLAGVALAGFAAFAFSGVLAFAASSSPQPLRPAEMARTAPRSPAVANFM